MASASGNGITAEQVVAAIHGSRGFVTVVGKRLGCSARHVYNLLDKYATARDALANEREGMRDFAEGMLYKRIEGGDTTAIIFYLKTQAKERGYVERQEVTGASGGAVAAEVKLDLSGLTTEQLRALAAWDADRKGED